MNLSLDLHDNGVADKLAKDGCEGTFIPGTSLMFLELFTNRKLLYNLFWLTPPTHHCYKAINNGIALSLDVSKLRSLGLPRDIFRAYLSFKARSMSAVPGAITRSLPPEYTIEWFSLSTDDLISNSLLVLDFIRDNKISLDCCQMLDN